MTKENYEKLKIEGLHNAMEKLLMRNDFYYSTGYYGLTIPILAQRKNKKKLEVLTLIPIYNYEKHGEKVIDYRGTLITDETGKPFETQFIRQFISITGIFDYFEEDKW